LKKRQQPITSDPIRDERSRIPGKRLWSIIGVFLIALICGGAIFADWWNCLPEDVSAHFVGRQTCAECHQTESKLWKGSHHDLAMDLATDDTVLGDFSDVMVEHHGVESKMFRDGDRYMVNTEGPDGKLTDFEIKYVFGVTPLQQYMVEFERHPDAKPTDVGRLQVLRISWDTEAKKWFYLAPPDVDEKLAPNDELHWTGIAQRWNNMCADCHSTNLQKNFDSKEKRYRTSFSEIDVSCEACHGAGSTHVQLAKSQSLFWDRKLGYGIAGLTGEKDQIRQVETCAKCHSRRRGVHPDFKPGEDFYDYYTTELLGDLTYYPDGQIKDEVYVHGSFIQSKMYHKGIRCSDCHDPHTARLKHNGNQVCVSCHTHSAGKYDTPAHHHHKPASTGSSCVECHMPETTYMAVDPRRDHSLRIPRPDLSVDLNTPNACVRCHLNDERHSDDKPSDEKFAKLPLYQDWLVASAEDEAAKSWLDQKNKWADATVREWYGDKKRPKHFAYALASARTGDPKAEEQLQSVIRNRTLPNIVRASAIAELAQFARSIDANTTFEDSLSDPHPLVRAAAAANLQSPDLSRMIRKLAPLLDDPSRTVRTEAARLLAVVPSPQLSGSQRKRHNAALAEFKQGVLLNNDRATSYLNLGILYESRDPEQAKKMYRTAIDLEPAFTGPRTNLAAIIDRELEQLQQQMKQLTLQRRKDEALKLVEKAASLQAELETLRVQELALLRRDSILAPNSGPIHYRYGFLNYLLGLTDEADKALNRAVELEPNNPDFLFALVLFYQKFERHADAIPIARRLVKLRPDDRQFQALLQQSLQRGIGPTRP